MKSGPTANTSHGFVLGQAIRVFPVLVLSYFLVQATACTTVPAAAPELADELTARIQATRTAHIALVGLYMDEKRTAVDRFILSEWIPVFAAELFKRPAVSAAWQKIVSENDVTERLQFIAGLGPRLQLQINEKRLELIRPLDETERAIVRRLAAHYDQMLSINATITGLLSAGAKATETRTRLLRALDKEQKLPQLFDKADQITRMLVGKIDDYEENRPKIEALLSELRKL